MAPTARMLRAVPAYRHPVPSRPVAAETTVRASQEVLKVIRLRAFVRQEQGLATIEYIIGAAVVLGTLVVGVQSWNNGLVTRLQALVTELGAVR